MHLQVLMRVRVPRIAQIPIQTLFYSVRIPQASRSPLPTDQKENIYNTSHILFSICIPSYSVKPKSIDFTGFDDFYLPQKQSRE